ncbi:hypothetical protein V6N11_000444 [Hibiscus sabdariffa]|uniref:Uncharacterized protein n=2 Tax=Hibiscus sabdariffa TaxID=183260 RepID=A0ABR2NT14_9ROSI
MNANSPYKQPAFDLHLSPITSPSGSSIVGGGGGGGACDSGWAIPFSMLGSHQSGLGRAPQEPRRIDITEVGFGIRLFPVRSGMQGVAQCYNGGHGLLAASTLSNAPCP